MTVVVTVFAAVGGFGVGVFLGLCFTAAIDLALVARHSKKECRECLRKRVEYGFHVDGKQYVCVERGS